jgi:hypothetical protein
LGSLYISTIYTIHLSDGGASIELHEARAQERSSLDKVSVCGK